MNVDYEKLTLTVTRWEAVDIFRSIKRDIERSIDEHWRHHPYAFDKSELRIPLITALAPFCGFDGRETVAEFKARISGAK